MDFATSTPIIFTTMCKIWRILMKTYLTGKLLMMTEHPWARSCFGCLWWTFVNSVEANITRFLTSSSSHLPQYISECWWSLISWLLWKDRESGHSVSQQVSTWHCQAEGLQLRTWQNLTIAWYPGTVWLNDLWPSLEAMLKEIQRLDFKWLLHLTMYFTGDDNF